jgi:uncharacterized protein DUF1259
MKLRLALHGLGVCVLALGCTQGSAPSPSAEQATASGRPAPGTAATGSPPPAANAIDPKTVEAATGLKPEVADGVVKVTYPRTEPKVEVDGWAMPPFMGLTSWIGFVPGAVPGVEAMIMGDLVLFQDEVDDAMSTALDGGLEVTALHNHFFYDKPHVYFMHVEGEGAVEALGTTVKKTLDAVKAVRAKSPLPRDRFDGPPMPAKSTIDAAAVEAALGRKGTAKDGMVKVVVGRPATTAACGCKIGKAMGVNTWAAIAGSNEIAAVDGDFAVTEDELQPVLKALRAGGIHVVAIHHHMTGEEPRVLFLHYWGRGSVATLGATLKGAIGLTKTEG